MAQAPQPLAAGPGNVKILTISIKELAALYSSYMSFTRGGGLFIPTQEQFQLGDEVMLLLTLMDHPDKLPLKGKVAWINYQQSAMRPKGIGITFPEDAIGNQAKSLIERYLASVLDNPHPTYTM